MKIYKTEQRLIKTLDKEICDWCGKDTAVPDDYTLYSNVDMHKDYDSYGDHWTTWGYKFDLCEECTLKLKDKLIELGIKVKGYLG